MDKLIKDKNEINAAINSASEQEIKNAKLIEASIIKLSKLDPEFIQTLVYISKFAEINPKQYSFIKGLLKKEVTKK
jgi:hypothetical protein